MARTTPRVLLVDGNSLGHRVFHARRDDPADTDGVTSRFLVLLTSVWWHGPYDGVYVAFDHPVNRRKQDVPEYKATRTDRDPALTTALDTIRRELAACGVAVDRRSGVEADDLLAAAVDACADLAWSCDVLSADQDLVALVDDHARLLRPRANFHDLQVLDVDAVCAHYGVPPAQYPDVAALRGDPSDGLDGVTGVGRKTAARLIREYGSVVDVYGALTSLPVSLEAALRDARARVERNLLVMAPIPHLAVDVRTAVRTWDLATVVDALAAHDPNGARRVRMNVEAPTPPRPPMPPPPDDESDAPNTTAGARRASPSVGVRDDARTEGPYDADDVDQPALFADGDG